MGKARLENAVTEMLAVGVVPGERVVPQEVNGGRWWAEVMETRTMGCQGRPGVHKARKPGVWAKGQQTGTCWALSLLLRKLLIYVIPTWKTDKLRQ